MAEIYNSTNNFSEKDNNQVGVSGVNNSSNGQSSASSLHAQSVFGFIKHKIEKLSTAVYMVTSYMPHDEPVRTSMRVLALSSVGHSGHLSIRQVSNHFSDLEKDIEHLLSLIRLSRTLDMISSMNADILEAEYQKILDYVRKQKDNKMTQLRPLAGSFDAHYKGEVKREQATDKFTDSSALLQRVVSPIIDSLPSESYKPVMPSASATNTNNTMSVKPKKFVALIENKERRSVRQEQVLKVLGVGEEMSIKDIALRVKGCSEKTIQRELNELLEQKKIKRLGDKRWSRYIKA